MRKKKWALLLLSVLLLAGYFKFFYKTYSETAVAKSVDCIITLDVKRITNTVIWNTLTTPSQWKKISFSSGGKISWKKMFIIPDYIFIFHSKNHPANAWYTVFDIKDKNDFNKGIQQYHFEKRNSTGNLKEYFSNESGVELLQNGNKVLLGNAAIQDKNFMRQIADELFSKNQYTSKEIIKKNIESGSHLALQIIKNEFLQQDAVIKANFDKSKIAVEAIITPQKQFNFLEYNFNYSANSLSILGFTQPPEQVYNLLSDSVKNNISKALNFNIDSLLLQNNTSYSMDVATIQQRKDSAVTYTYDDNFNAIEKVAVNNVLEPAFNFTVRGQGVSSVYNYFKNKGKLENTPAGDLFVPMLFVKSYCSKKTERELNITSGNYQMNAADASINCILFLNMLLTKIPPPVLKYLPDDLVKAIANIESVNLYAKKKNEKIIFHCSCNKKNNDLPVVNW